MRDFSGKKERESPHTQIQKFNGGSRNCDVASAIHNRAYVARDKFSIQLLNEKAGGGFQHEAFTTFDCGAADAHIIIMGQESGQNQ
jgi:hypothetical protein